jgi:hypothetical protein
MEFGLGRQFPLGLASGRKVVSERGATGEAGADLMWTARGGRSAGTNLESLAKVVALSPQGNFITNREHAHLRAAGMLHMRASTFTMGIATWCKC